MKFNQTSNQTSNFRFNLIITRNLIPDHWSQLFLIYLRHTIVSIITILEVGMFLKDRSIDCKNLFADNKEICNKCIGF